MSLSEAHELVGDFASMVVEFQEPSMLWPMMLAKLQEAVGFDAGYIAASWGSAIEGRGAVAEHDEPFLKRNIGRYLAEISPEEVAKYTNRARIHHDVWSRDRQKELAVFREVLDPTGMKHMIVRVSAQHGNVAGFNLERRDASAPFSTRELTLVDMVAPFLHIVEVLTLRAQDDAGLEELAFQHGLTKREKEFVGLAARGLQNSEIGMLTHVSANTVRNTLAKVFEKVGVTNRAELSYLAARPATDRQGRTAIVPPPSRLPGDGMEAFVSRVEEASAKKLIEASQRIEALRTSRIVYTPPLTPETT
jgi:DNA-binding CsgD family transcriptional regulator